MALPPSRRDTIGPPPRDVTDLARIVRHHGSYLRSLDPGILDGQYATPRPVRGGPSQLVGEDAGGEGGEDIEFWNTDRAVASVNGRIVLRLTYEPIEGSLHIRCGAAFLETWEYVLDGQTVTYVNSHIRSGKTTLTAAYTYITTDGADVLDSLVLRGVTVHTGLLPVETEAGDFVVIATRNSDPGYSDSRFPLLPTAGTESQVRAGIATDLTPLVPAGGGTGLVVVASFVGGATVDTVNFDTDPSAPSVPSQPGLAAIGVVSERSSIVAGSTSLPAPWSFAATDIEAPGWGRVAVYYWFDATANVTPAATALTSGGVDETEAFLITLTGEE